jgi:hypothetical protein
MKVHWPPTLLKVLYYTIFTSDPEEPFWLHPPKDGETNRLRILERTFECIHERGE